MVINTSNVPYKENQFNAYPFVEDLKSACVTILVVLAIKDHLHSVLNHVGTELLGDRRGGAHGRASVDLKHPRHEIIGQHEVGSVQLKGILPTTKKI